MRLINFIFILIGVAILSAFITFFVYNDISVIEIKEISVDANFTNFNKVGFNLDKDMMHFGKIPVGGSGERSFELSNTKKFPVSAKIYAVGDIKDYIIVKENDIRLLPGETKNAKVGVYAPINAEKKGYTGKIIIEIRWSPI